MNARLAIAILICAAGGAARADDAQDLEALGGAAAELRPIVAEVRGLAWKREVAVELATAPPENPRWAGFYNPRQDRITVIDRRRATWPFILAHELTHALQEQYCRGAF